MVSVPWSKAVRAMLSLLWVFDKWSAVCTESSYGLCSALFCKSCFAAFTAVASHSCAGSGLVGRSVKVLNGKRSMGLDLLVMVLRLSLVTMEVGSRTRWLLPSSALRIAS